MSTIRILEPDANRRGDLFGRLMADLFVALGYEQPRMNIHKSGREIDLSANHRLEPRRAVGECKATEETIGGGELNKFVGALDAEHDEKVQISGYFISLAGFKETAIEQEKLRRRTKIITLTGEQVVGELIKGRIIVPSERATELAGRCSAGHLHLTLDGTPELVAHERGWIWTIYYSLGKVRTSFVLIHADGTPLGSALALKIIGSDQAIGGSLHQLSCLNPSPAEVVVTPGLEKAAMSAYSRYISEECGFIQLDGLPADSEVGSRRLKLENLFVPLHIDIPSKEKLRQAVGAALVDHSRLAILAAPGGGKSTLIKRIAVAYADAQRRSLVPDDLPENSWLPLFFRCRELRGLARASFVELLEALAHREPVRQHAHTFRALADRALIEGRVLLLVDGLDEISDAGDRAAFVCTMRTALQAYPGTAIIVTSREAGFRHVAAHLASVCTYATLSPFDAEDIRRLSVAWHAEVVGGAEKVRNDAERLARTISNNDRIQRLAINPLLLTTLLLVKRWVGSLPTRRAVLYGKAVEVLLITWNTEGHEPIPEEEALPQLCYVASAMMIARVERISRPKLAILVQEARDSLPTELGYVKGTVEEFIHRVEDRSSLLMMTGHDVEDGRLVEFFEFRHLTFQEFLTARAMVEGWHPGRTESDTLVNVLEPHFDEEKWREVIPLSASLGGKATEALINRLTERFGAFDSDKRWEDREKPSFIALGHCLADEAAARPETIRSALRVLVKVGLQSGRQSFVPMLARGRYGNELRYEAERSFISGEEPNASATSLKQVVWWQSSEGDDHPNHPQLALLFTEMLRNEDRLIRCKGALACVELLQHKRGANVLGRAVTNAIADACVPLLFSNDCRENYVAGWLLYTLGKMRVWVPPAEPDVLGRMFNLWQHSPSKSVRGGLPSTLAAQEVQPREDQLRFSTVESSNISVVIKKYSELSDHSEKHAVLVAAWYTRTLNDREIVGRSQELLKKMRHPYKVTLQELLKHLGVQPAEREDEVEHRELMISDESTAI
ncbi:MAG TPA: NACHT domain-containing protein [Chthoniobacteraceae bacterium]|nr:NACHT domain-containing protein [Chthoniobacteraceae bacterium]